MLLPTAMVSEVAFCDILAVQSRDQVRPIVFCDPGTAWSTAQQNSVTNVNSVFFSFFVGFTVLSYTGFAHDN